MKFAILGPLRATDDNHETVVLRGRRRRILLLALLSHPNAVVSTEDLVEWLWPTRPPRAALTTLHAHISMLRSCLEPHRSPWRPANRLLTHAPGYLLKVGDDELDAQRFERLVREARRLFRAGDADGAQRLLTEGLAPWRGPPLADAT